MLKGNFFPKLSLSSLWKKRLRTKIKYPFLQTPGPSEPSVNMGDYYELILSVWMFLFLLWIPVAVRLAMMTCVMFKSAQEIQN